MSETDNVKADAPRFVGGPPRTKAVRLKWPMEFKDRKYREVVVRRVTVREVGDFVEAIRDGVTGARLPMFETADGEPIPVEVLEGMDPDDAARLNTEAESFLPASLRGALGTASASSTGEPSPSS
jgi:hypothetical protein